MHRQIVLSGVGSQRRKFDFEDAALVVCVVDYADCVSDDIGVEGSTHAHPHEWDEKLANLSWTNITEPDCGHCLRRPVKTYDILVEGHLVNEAISEHPGRVIKVLQLRLEEPRASHHMHEEEDYQA